MKSRINKIISNFKTVYASEPWYGDSLQSILKNVNPKTIFSKAGENSHSIAELLAHIIDCRDFTLRSISGDDNSELSQTKSFNWKRIDNNENTAWQSLLGALEKNQNEILNILQQSGDDLLDEKVHGKNYNNDFLLEGIIQHDIYHIGQISILNRILNG